MAQWWRHAAVQTRRRPTVNAINRGLVYGLDCDDVHRTGNSSDVAV